MSSQYLASYRSVLRELAKFSITTRDKRNRDISANIRAIFEDHRKYWKTNGSDAANKERQQRLLSAISNSVTYLRSQRTYKELIDRYNPLHDMSQQERTRATARRVGMDMPIEAKSK